MLMKIGTYFFVANSPHSLTSSPQIQPLSVGLTFSPFSSLLYQNLSLPTRTWLFFTYYRATRGVADPSDVNWQQSAVRGSLLELFGLDGCMTLDHILRGHSLWPRHKVPEAYRKLSRLRCPTWKDRPTNFSCKSMTSKEVSIDIAFIFSICVGFSLWLNPILTFNF